MALMPKTIPVADLDQLCRDVLTKCGLSDADARIAADVLVTTDTFGVFTHGTNALAGYVRRLRAGGLKAEAQADRGTRRPGLGHRRRPSRLGDGYFGVRHEHGHRKGQEGRRGLRGRAEQLPLRRRRLLRSTWPPRPT